eukprot:GGOE01019091.1.p1 GENE.GGOE01019091.1~~GGOE01019091.1.p1  ORF type:complete len:520 (+),score=116.26 GGOE01019091.1:63-1622(+)
MARQPALEMISRALSDDFAKLQAGLWGKRAPLKPSLFPHRPATIAFLSNPDQYNDFVEVDSNRSLFFSCTAAQYYSLRIPLLKAGFRRVTDGDVERSPSIALCRPFPALPISIMELGQVPAGESGVVPQKVNHFPKSGLLGSKSQLARALQRMQRRFGRDKFRFMPETHVVPQQLEQALAMVIRDKTHCSGAERPRYILKPALGSCGRGIRVLDAAEAIKLLRSMCKGEWTGSECVLQKLVEPMLVHDHKWDMRLYVLVTAFDPLTVYLYSDGLVRFASKGYSPAGEFDRFADLTNYSINRYAKPDPEGAIVSLGLGDGKGTKWAVCELKEYLKSSHPEMNQEKLWQKIHTAIIGTLVSVAGPITEATKQVQALRHGCFELFGFDILLDADQEPHLLEVNILPSMESSSQLDYDIKSAVATDTFNMLLLQVYDRDQRSYPAINPETAQEAICNFEDANAHRGGFQLLFPTPDTIPRFSPFFCHASAYDASLWDWVKVRGTSDGDPATLLQTLQTRPAEA